MAETEIDKIREGWSGQIELLQSKSQLIHKINEQDKQADATDLRILVTQTVTNGLAAIEDSSMTFSARTELVAKLNSYVANTANMVDDTASCIVSVSAIKVCAQKSLVTMRDDEMLAWIHNLHEAGINLGKFVLAYGPSSITDSLARVKRFTDNLLLAFIAEYDKKVDLAEYLFHTKPQKRSIGIVKWSGDAQAPESIKHVFPSASQLLFSTCSYPPPLNYQAVPNDDYRAQNVIVKLEKLLPSEASKSKAWKTVPDMRIVISRDRGIYWQRKKLAKFYDTLLGLLNNGDHSMGDREKQIGAVVRVFLERREEVGDDSSYSHTKVIDHVLNDIRAGRIPELASDGNQHPAVQSPKKQKIVGFNRLFASYQAAKSARNKTNRAVLYRHAEDTAAEELIYAIHALVDDMGPPSTADDLLDAEKNLIAELRTFADGARRPALHLASYILLCGVIQNFMLANAVQTEKSFGSRILLRNVVDQLKNMILLTSSFTARLADKSEECGVGWPEPAISVQFIQRADPCRGRGSLEFIADVAQNNATRKFQKYAQAHGQFQNYMKAAEVTGSNKVLDGFFAEFEESKADVDQIGDIMRRLESFAAGPAASTKADSSKETNTSDNSIPIRTANSRPRVRSAGLAQPTSPVGEEEGSLRCDHLNETTDFEDAADKPSDGHEYSYLAKGDNQKPNAPTGDNNHDQAGNGDDPANSGNNGSDEAGRDNPNDRDDQDRDRRDQAAKDVAMEVSDTASSLARVPPLDSDTGRCRLLLMQAYAMMNAARMSKEKLDSIHFVLMSIVRSTNDSLLVVYLASALTIKLTLLRCDEIKSSSPTNEPHNIDKVMREPALVCKAMKDVIVEIGNQFGLGADGEPIPDEIRELKLADIREMDPFGSHIYPDDQWRLRVVGDPKRKDIKSIFAPYRGDPGTQEYVHPEMFYISLLVEKTITVRPSQWVEPALEAIRYFADLATPRRAEDLDSFRSPLTFPFRSILLAGMTTCLDRLFSGKEIFPQGMPDEDRATACEMFREFANSIHETHNTPGSLLAEELVANRARVIGNLWARAWLVVNGAPSQSEDEGFVGNFKYLTLEDQVDDVARDDEVERSGENLIDTDGKQVDETEVAGSDEDEQVDDAEVAGDEDEEQVDGTEVTGGEEDEQMDETEVTGGEEAQQSQDHAAERKVDEMEGLE